MVFRFRVFVRLHTKVFLQTFNIQRRWSESFHYYYLVKRSPPLFRESFLLTSHDFDGYFPFRRRRRRRRRRLLIKTSYY